MTYAKSDEIFSKQFTANLPGNLFVKKTENRLRVDTIVATSLQPHFLAHPVYFFPSAADDTACRYESTKFMYDWTWYEFAVTWLQSDLSFSCMLAAFQVQFSPDICSCYALNKKGSRHRAVMVFQTRQKTFADRLLRNGRHCSDIVAGDSRASRCARQRFLSTFLRVFSRA